MVVLGNSHAELGIDDGSLVRTINLSRSAHSFFENYIKTTYLTTNNEIDRLILEVGHTDLSKHSEDIWILSNPILKGEIGNYLGMIPLVDLIELATYSSVKNVVTNLFTSLDQAFIELFLRKKTYADFGGYIQFDRNLDLDSLYSVVKMEVIMGRSQIAEYNLLQLDKIVDHCEKNNVELIFITAPVHKYYLDIFDDIDLDSILSIRYPEITHFDFSDYCLSEDRFSDLGHLNSLGAADFTEILKLKNIIE
ncbi:hypothetical protein OAU18_00935 [Schleiferiaceae bacterium]|nr:hypothetical protein [Schleiferiaceae bacterium]